MPVIRLSDYRARRAARSADACERELARVRRSIAVLHATLHALTPSDTAGLSTVSLALREAADVVAEVAGSREKDAG